MGGTMVESIPFQNLRVGDVLQRTRLRIGTSKVKDGATVFISTSGEKHYFRGNSEHAQSNEMSEYSASLKIAGKALGIGWSIALGGYYGSFQLAADKDLHLNVHAIKWTGIESIPFDKLTMEGLISLLEPKCQKAVRYLLAEYEKIRYNFLNLDEQQILANKQRQGIASDYGKQVNKFLDDFGDGIVVGILWGGYTVLDLAIHFHDIEERCRVGAEGVMTVAGPYFAGPVSAAWGKKGSVDNSSATAKLTPYVWGDCMDGLVSSWNQKFSEAATKFETFKDVDVFPSTILNQKPPTPTLPAFQPPNAQTQKDMRIDGLKAVSIACAFEQYLAECEANKTKPTRKLDEFIADFQAKAEEPKLPEISVEKILPNKAAVNAINRDGAAVNLGQPSPNPKLVPPAPMVNDPREAYTPVGVWVMRWGQLFPWITTATKNALPPPEDASWDPMRYRILLQDLVSLERIYRHVAGSRVDIEAFKNNNGAGGIADEFAGAISTLMEWGVSGTFPPKADLPLGDTAWKILRHWDKLGSRFRAAHLGFAVYSNWHRSNEGADHFVFTDLDLPSNTFSGRTVNFNGHNYAIFKHTMKALPLIIPDVVAGADPGVFCFICTGKTDGKRAWDGVLGIDCPSSPRFKSNEVMHVLFRSVSNKQLAESFSDGDKPEAYAVRFSAAGVWETISISCFVTNTITIFKGKDNLDKNSSVGMFPIPFSSAGPLDGWSGPAVATGVRDIEAALSKLKDSAANLPLWTPDSDSWPGKSLDPDEVYSIHTMDSALYLGLVDNPK
jgi:hypothetical protein